MTAVGTPFLVCSTMGGQVATPESIAACATALREGSRDLRALGFAARASRLADIGRAWLDAAPLDDESLARCAEELGYHPAMLRWGMREACSRWTIQGFEELWAQELGEVATPRPPGPQGVPGHARHEQLVPTLCGQVLASTVPPAGLEAVVLPLLLGSPVLVRPAQAMTSWVLAFLESFETLAPELAPHVALASFGHDTRALAAAYAQCCDALVVHGGEASVSAWRELAPTGARFVPYGHRVSASFIGGATLASTDLDGVLVGVAEDLLAWEQEGCLSPQVLFVEQPAAMTHVDLARRLAEEVLGAAELRLPPFSMDVATRAARANHLRALRFEGQVFESPGGTAVVACDGPGPLVPAAYRRVLRLRPVASLDELVEQCRAAAPHLQALALDPHDGAAQTLSEALAPAGLNRICRHGQLQRPPLWWRHDGVGSLAPLVRWVSLG